MKKRYTSDPNKALRRNAFKFNKLFLALLALLLLGGNVAVADNWPTASGTDPTDIDATATYYIYSAATDNGDGTYKFYLLTSEVNPAEYSFSGLTEYDYLSACRIDGGSNSTANGSGIKLTLVFNTSHPVGFVGFFCVNDGTLEMKLGEYYTNTDGITLKRTDNWTTYTNSNYNCPFTIPDNNPGNNNPGNSFNYNTNEKNVDAQKIVITGKASASTSPYDPTCQFVIDGGCTPYVNETGSGALADYTITYSDNSKIGKTTMFRVMCGTLSLTHVTLQNCCSSGGSTGGIYVITNAGNTIDRKSSVKVDLDHCWLHHLANTCPAFYIQYTIASYTGAADKKPSLTLKDCKLSDCYSTNKANGAIRSHSNSLCNLTVTNCTIEKNYGGGVRWQSTKACTASFTNCTIDNNKRFLSDGVDATDGCGGGVIIKSSASITGCTITNNWAQKSGGGIYFSTFDEGDGINNKYVPEHGVLSLDAVDNTGTKTLIQGNEAVENGGGVAVFGNRITVAPYYGYTNGEQDGLYTMTLNMNGAIVENNTAGQDGGGIFVSRSDKASFYKQTCNLNYGTIQSNTAGRGGGGVAIKSSSTFDNSTGLPDPQPSEFGPQDIVVEIGKGKEGDDTQDMKILSNTATENGGGVYVEAYSLTYNGHTSNVYTTLYGHAKIQKKDGAASGNYATNNGGGLYMKKGTVYFNDCTISDNKADNDGGGVYMEEGEITTAIRSTAEVSQTPTSSTLPGDYQNVEWISSNGGTGYIVTDIQLNSNHTIWADGKRESRESYLLNGRNPSNDGNSGTRMGIKLLSSKLQCYWRMNNVGTNLAEWSYSGISIGSGARFSYAMNKSNLVIMDENGTVKKTIDLNGNPASETTISNYWQIFKGLSGNTGGILYEAKIWEGGTINTTTGEVTGGTLVAHFIPCKHRNNGKIGVFNLAKYDDGSTYTPDECFIEGSGSLAIPAGSKGDPLAGDGNGTSTGSATGTSAGPATATREVSGCTIRGNKAQYDGGGIYLHKGNIFLTNTLITENQAIDSCGGGIYDHDGNIYLNYWDAADPNSGTNYTVRGETTPSEVTDNTAGRNGGGINTHKGRIFARGQSPSQDIVISGNTAGSGDNKKGSGGGIFCMGNTIDPTAEQLRLINVNLVGNKAYGTQTTTHAGETVTNGCGGGMYLQYGAINITKVALQGNYAEQNGGAVNNHNGVINVSGCIIGGNDYYSAGNALEGNKADSCGGGIYTQNGNINISNHYDAGLADHITKISYNIAADNGGGINTHSGKVVATGEYTVDAGKHILINNNKATNGSGGGIFCMGSGTGTFADPDLKLTYAKLIGNQAASGTGTTATGGVTTGCGGGMYLHNGAILVTDADMEGNLANWNGGAINNHDGNIFILGSIVGGDSYYTNGAAGQGNKANHSGGGIYTNLGNIDIRDYVEHLQGSVRHLESKVTYNEAGENGGGIDTHSGTITVNFDSGTGLERETDQQIEITHNKAKKGGGIYANAGTIITANAMIDYNEATENGGGVNNHAGDITFYGGSLSNNTAVNGKGGGAFTYVGDIDIFPFPVNVASPTLNEGTNVYNNKANLNGGGINNHTGRVDVRYATLRNNTSTLGNGGGIFCEGPHSNATGYTIRMLNSQLKHNKTRGQDGTPTDPTGRGGGIYLKYGSIFAQNSQIHENFANINGGGLDNHDGTILVYGCDITDNRAVTGKGGGIYTQTGSITTGPSLVSGSSQATLIQGNTAQINGGGINNHEGDIFLNGDLIMHNTAVEGNGGGIYIANGTIDMYGGKMAFNTAGQDGGGVYTGGGTFNINKREGKPIVEIIDVDVVRSGNPKVHYHLIDQGSGTLGDPVNSTPAFTSPQEHGIIWGTTESDVENAILGTLGSCTKISCTYADMEKSGCYRIPITSGISASNTYYVKAYAINSDSKTNYSDVVAFTTYSSTPTVITGSVSNIIPDIANVGKYAAEANAKVIDSGSYSILQRGFCYAATKKLPTLSDFHVEESPLGTAAFYTCDLSNLNPNTTYWIRAYEKNSNNEIGYGDTLRFTTPKLVPNLNGNMVSIGDGTGGTTAITANSAQFTFDLPAQTTGVKAYGFIWSTDDDPELKEDHSHHWIIEPASTSATTFTFTPSDLTAGTKYYVRAFATFEAYDQGADPGRYAFSTPKEFYTLGEGGKPVVIFKAFSGVTRTSATITGELKSKGQAITKYGVCYSTNSTLPTEHGTGCFHVERTGDLAVNTPFDIDLPSSNPDLIPNTTYYLRVYATSSNEVDPDEDDIAYSNVFSFTTLPVTPPTVEVEVIDINNTTATVKCTVNTNGAPLRDPYGIRWKVDGGSYYTDLTSTNYDVSTGIYTVVLDETTVPTTGLTADTKYWVKAFCTNATGVANDGSGPYEGREVSFNTLYPKPTVDAVTIDGILYDASGATSHTIRVYGNAAQGAASHPVQKFGFIYSTRADATIATISDEYDEEYVEVGPSNMGSSHKTNLTAKVKDNREYWVRAYASAKASPTSDSDYSYGAATKVLTLPQVNRTTETPATTHKSAQLPARIVSNDENHFLKKYGVCWKLKASGTPTVDDAHYEDDIISTPMDFSLNTAQAGSNLAPGEYYWRAYVKNQDYNETTAPDKGIAYTTDGTFKIYQYGITTEVVPAGSGSVSGGGYYDTIVGGVSPAVNLTATNSTSDYAFEKWTKIPDETGVEVDAGTDNPLVISEGTMVSAHYKAWFTSKVTVTAGAGGQVRFGTTGDYSTTANQQFSYNTNCTVSPQANSGYTFLNWTDASGNFVSDVEEYTFPVTGPITLTANFNSRGNTSTSNATPRPRDIYPAPAREPWDWDEDDCTLNPHGGQGSAIPCAEGSTLRSGDCGSAPAMKGFGAMSTDTLAERGERAILEAPVDIPLIQSNTATRGGGIFMAEKASPSAPRAQLLFSGGANSSEQGKIIFNYASEAGGGIYIDTTAFMHMKGHCMVNANHVPEGKDGGGIYLKGRLYVGEAGSSATDNGLIVNQNFAIGTDKAGFDSTTYVADPPTYTNNNKGKLNNTCLMRHTYSFDHSLIDGTYDDEAAVICLLSDISGFSYTDSNGNGTYDSGDPSTTTAASSIGFHVTQGFCPVLTTSDGFPNAYMKTWKGNGIASNPYEYDYNEEYEQRLQNIMWSSVGTDGTFGNAGAIFEDTESYVAIHTRQPNRPFNSKYLYLWGCWTHPAVKTDPEVNSPMSGEDFCGHYKITDKTGDILTWEIYSEEGLAWFSSYVNGLNAFTPGYGDAHSTTTHKAYEWDAARNPKAKAILKADLDLNEHFWVPIGSVTIFSDDISGGLSSGSLFEDQTANPHHFEGSFDGQGHTIKGIDCRYLSGIYKLGLFGYLSDNAVVKNVFIDEAHFEASDNTKAYHVGSVAGKMTSSATLSAVEARATIDISNAAAASYVGGLVGEADGTNTIHSSMAMPEIIGQAQYTGGLVGKLGAGNFLYNSFGNPKFNDDPADGKYFGGLVGVNEGTVENCYARLQNTTDPARFGYLAGTNNTNNIQYSYIPSGKTNYQANGSGVVSGHGTYAGTNRLNGKYRYDHHDQQMTAVNSSDATYITDELNGKLIVGGLTSTLNEWVTTKGSNTYHPWMRTMASTINDDLPILNFKVDDGSKALTPNPAYNAVGSKDGMYMEYVLDVNDKLTEYAALASGTPEIYLYDANTQGDGTTHQDITVTNIGTTPEVKLYINEDVGIKVSGAASSTGLKARVGVTIRNSRGESDPNWHLFSSAVAADDANIGLVYHTKEGGYAGVNDYILKSLLDDDTSINISDAIYNSANRAMDPPQTTWSDTDLGYFPTNTPYGTWRTTPASTGFFDLYDYSEKTYHWINYKREGTSACMDHWHMDPEFGTMDHYKIHYINETQMAPGKGFLMALAHETMMMADGVLNTGNKTISVTHTSTSVNTPPNGSVGTYNYNLPWRSLNLIGNPYQSYLDFNEFHTENGSFIDNVYGTREDDGKSYIYYTPGGSTTDFTASQYIHPHQGFFVKKTDGEGSSTLTFTDAMRVAGTSASLSSPYRNQLNYPLVVLLSYDSNGGRDLTTVEVNRPELGGGGKMHSLRTSNASVYASFEDKDWQTLFTPEGVSEVPVRFEAFEDGEYTFNWETYHGDFSYLHLIDNLAGKDIDCLSATEYKFEGKTTDYHSRFKLVFQCTGVEENLDDATTVNFAFQREDELIVNGEGQLEMFDITGRRLMDTQAVGEQSHYSLPKVAAGVYLLRLSSNQQVKIQKIILQ